MLNIPVISSTFGGNFARMCRNVECCAPAPCATANMQHLSGPITIASRYGLSHYVLQGLEGCRRIIALHPPKHLSNLAFSSCMVVCWPCWDGYDAPFSDMRKSCREG